LVLCAATGGLETSRTPGQQRFVSKTARAAQMVATEPDVLKVIASGTYRPQVPLKCGSPMKSFKWLGSELQLLLESFLCRLQVTHLSRLKATSVGLDESF
jgi:hypothetical protein